jgi:hypothetical protein
MWALKASTLSTTVSIEAYISPLGADEINGTLVGALSNN